MNYFTLMVKFQEYARDILKGFHKEMEGKADYIHSCVELGKSQKQKFKDGWSYGTSADYSLSTKIEILKGEELTLLTAELIEGIPSAKVGQRDVKFLIEQARKNAIRTDVVIPKKELPIPAKSHIGDDKSISIPPDFTRSLKDATKNDSDFLIYSSYGFDSRKIYQLDSNGVENFQVLRNLHVYFNVYISPEEMIDRTLGINPQTITDINHLYEMMKFISDISPEQHFRDATSPVELVEKLTKTAKNMSKNGQRISNGLFNVITPSPVPFHEMLGHYFEGTVRMKRKYPEESTYEARSLFDEYTKNLSIPKSLSLISNPLMNSDEEIEKMNRVRLFGGFDYDLEMFPAERKVLIDRGKIGGRKIGSRYADVNEVGNAMSSVLSSIPQPRMCVLYAPPATKGPKSVEEMIEMTDKKNVLLTVKSIGECFSEEGFAHIGRIGIDDTYKTLELSPEAYIVKNGNLVPVKIPFHFSTLSYRAFPDLVLSDRDLYYVDSGYCGSEIPKGGYDFVPTTQLGPMLLMKNTPVITYEKRV